MSWKPIVIADNTGKWYDNALRFATYEEAYASAPELAMRWLAVRDWRAIESEDPVKHKLVNGRLIHIDTREEYLRHSKGE